MRENTLSVLHWEWTVIEDPILHALINSYRSARLRVEYEEAPDLQKLRDQYLTAAQSLSEVLSVYFCQEDEAQTILEKHVEIFHLSGEKRESALQKLYEDHPDLEDFIDEWVDEQEVMAEAFRRNGRIATVVAGTADGNGNDRRDDDQQHPWIGQVVGDYRIEAVIGRGGMGVVFRGRKTIGDAGSSAELIAAIKSIRGNDWNDSTEEVRLFLREIQLLGDLQNQHIVPIRDADLHDGTPFLVMPYLSGGTLQDRLGTYRHRYREIAALMAEIARTVQTAHNQHLLHRDLKPQNILFDGIEQFFISDFGLAQLKAAKAEFAAATPTMSGRSRQKRIATLYSVNRMGTPGYSAPEQCPPIGSPAQHQLIREASDVFSLGAILFALVTGEKPPDFQMAGLTATGRPIFQELPSCRELDAKVPVALEAIIRTCLQPNPDDRYQKASEVAAELTRFLKHEPIKMASYRADQLLFLFCRRNLLLTVCTAAACMLIGSFVGFTIWHLGQIQREHAITQKALEKEEQTSHSLIVREAQRSRQAGHFEIARGMLCRIAPRRRSLDDAIMAGDEIWTSRRLLALHEGPLTGLLVDRIHGRVVSTGLDGRVIVTRLSDGVETAVLAPGLWSEAERRFKLLVEYPPQECPFDVYLDLRWIDLGERFAGLTTSGRMDVWDLSAGELVEKTMTGLIADVFEARPNSEIRVLGCRDGRVILWSPSGGILSSINAEGPVTDLVTHPNGNWIVATASGQILLLDSDVTQILSRLPLAETIWDLSLNDDGNTLAAATNRSGPVIVKIKDESFSPPIHLPPPLDAVLDQRSSIQVVQFARGGRQLWAGTSSSTVCAWDLSESRLVQNRTVSTSQSSILGNNFDRFPHRLRRVLTAIEAGENESEVLMGGRNGAVMETTWNGGPETIRLTEGAKLSFSSTDPDFLLEATPKGDVNGWRLNSGHQVSTHENRHGSEVCSMSWSTDGTVLTASIDGAIRFSRCQNDHLVDFRSGYQHSTPIRAACISPDGQRFAVLDVSGVISLMSVSDFRQFGTHEESPEFAALTNDIVFDRKGEQLLAFGAPGGSVVVSGRNGRLESYKEWLSVGQGTSIVRDPDQDGGFLVGDQMGRISIIPLGAIPSGFTFEGQVPLVGVAIVGGSSKSNPFRRRLVACSRAGEIRFAVSDGDFATFSILSPIASQRNPATGLLLSCDDHTLAVPHADGRLVIWRADPSSLIDSSPARSLTPEFSHFFDHDVELTKKSVIPLDDGSVAMLFLGKIKSSTKRELILAKWHPEQRQWKSRIIRQISVSENDPGTLDSMALTRIGQRLFGCVREQTEGYSARCFFFQVPINCTLGERATRK